MTTKRGQPKRNDLMYRDSLQELLGDTFLDDPRFNDMTERVIAHMHKTDPADWTKDLWTIFKLVFQAKKDRAKPLSERERVALMSSEDLSASLRGTPSTSKS